MSFSKYEFIFYYKMDKVKIDILLPELVEEILLYLPYLDNYEKYNITDKFRERWYNSQVVIKNDRYRTTYQINDKFHRENDLPAIIKANGTKQWYKDGKLHRENDLPAIEYANGTKYWYINGKKIKIQRT
jgi:hypothetical protein